MSTEQSSYVITGVSPNPNATAKEDPSFQGAIENAYEQARKRDPDAAAIRLRVLDIVVTGTNPISEYRVIVTTS